jgi:hypothetical protein
MLSKDSVFSTSSSSPFFFTACAFFPIDHGGRQGIGFSHNADAGRPVSKVWAALLGREVLVAYIVHAVTEPDNALSTVAAALIPSRQEPQR